MVLPNGMEYEYSIPVLKAQAYTPEMMAQKELTILFPFSPIRFRRRLDTILEMEKKSSASGKIQEMRDALKKDLTKFILDCIMIINREEENGTLRGSTGADIVEYMGRTCDYIFNKEPELLKGVHEVMEPVIKLIREEAEDTFKLLREQKEEELSLLREQKEGELNLLREKMDDELNLLREQKDAEIMQMEDQLDKFIQNYIIQCKKEGKLKGQVEKELQSNFSLPLRNVRLKMEKWW